MPRHHAYTIRTHSMCSQVLNQLAKDYDDNKENVAIPIMYNDEVAYLMENA